MPSDVAVAVGRPAGMSPRQQVQPRFATGRANDAASLLPGAPKLLDVPAAARFRRRNGRHNCQARRRVQHCAKAYVGLRGCQAPPLECASGCGNRPLDRVDHVFDFTDADTLQHVRLAERLSLSGVVTRYGEPMTRATLWLTRPTGESVGTARTDASGITCSRFRRPAGTS